VNRSTPIFDWAFSQAHKPAIVSDTETHTWGQLRDGILRAATVLQDRIAPGTRIALFIDSTPEFVLYYYAALYLGGVVTPLNRAMKPDEIADAVASLGIALVISDEAVDAGVPNHVVAGFDLPAPDGPVPPPAVLGPRDPAQVLLTSGSTGRPKGVVLTVGNLASNYDPTHRWIGLGNTDRLLLTLPIFNTYALNQGLNLLAMTGGTMRLVRRFSVEAMQQAFDDFQPTFVPLVPTMLTRLYQAGVVYDRPVTLGLGAASAPGQVVGQAWSVFPQAFLFFGYGLTEGTAIVSQNRVGTAIDNNGDFVSVGVPVPGVQVRIDAPGGEDLRGEIQIAGEMGFDSYVGGEARPVTDGWMQTGDIGRFEGERLYIVDRKRDLIIRGGQNIYPGEIEHLLSSHESVLEASIVARLDDELGELPVAFVVVKDGTAPAPGDLLEWMRSRTSAYKVPVAVHIIDAMPKTPTGKIRKLDLREALARGDYA
jgi:long-chain acyl-CoA synthetase